MSSGSDIACTETKVLGNPSPPRPKGRKAQYLRDAEAELKAVLEIIRSKNADYTAGADDPFANFRATEALGLASKEVGVLIRMMDKIQRIRSYLDKGELQVPGEGVEDACRDIIGYSLLLLGMLREEK